MNILDLIQGFIIGGSLIIAIGPQNLFVIQQGLKKNYVLITVLICSFSDAFLIIIGIFLSSIIINFDPISINILKYIGGCWLIIYGFNKITNSKKNNINNKDNFINDKLITCDISGYGQTGPYSQRKAYDLLVQAESGLCSITGNPDSPGRVGVSVCDIACGLNAHSAILQALLLREKTGKG